jgi:hypothetical protein
LADLADYHLLRWRRLYANWRLAASQFVKLQIVFTSHPQPLHAQHVGWAEKQGLSSGSLREGYAPFMDKVKSPICKSLEVQNGR